MHRLPTNRSAEIITTDQQLVELCDRLREAGRFAFDTEFIMEDAYQSVVCLIQAATDSEVALIDPLAGLDPTPFWALVTDPEILIILHAGAEDLALCWQFTGQTPRNVFDVQVAAGLVSSEYPLSLARLVNTRLGVRLHKSQTLTDWRRRPLTDAQQMYALEDVAHLPALHAKLEERLERNGRADWAQEEFARFEDPEAYEPPRASRVLRLKGAGSLDSQGLAIAGELLEVRERLAQQYNRPARAVLRDHLLVEIARHRWTSPQQIRALRGLHLRSAAIERLGKAVKRGLNVPPEDHPRPQATLERTPEEVVLSTLLTAVLRDFCAAQNVAFSLLTNKENIDQVVRAHTRRHRDESRLSAGWRKSLVGKLLKDLLRGRLMVCATGRGARTRLEIIARNDD